MDDDNKPADDTTGSVDADKENGEDVNVEGGEGEKKPEGESTPTE